MPAKDREKEQPYILEVNSMPGFGGIERATKNKSVTEEILKTYMNRNNWRQIMINALRKKYEAEVAAAKANIDVYINNPVGIGEHPDLVGAMDLEMTKLADASDKLATLNSFYPETAEEFLSEENK